MASRPWFLSLTAFMVGAAACAEPPTIVVQPLRVINWSPASGAVCVDVATTRALVTFSDDIEVPSLSADTFRVTTADGTAVATTIGYDKATLTASLSFAATLDFDRVYAIVVGDAVQSAKQGRLGVEVSSSFQTIKRTGCTPGLQCQLASDCLGTEVCGSAGVCISQCQTDRDCPSGRSCQAGSCN